VSRRRSFVKHGSLSRFNSSVTVSPMSCKSTPSFVSSSKDDLSVSNYCLPYDNKMDEDRADLTSDRIGLREH
jgi:hypothetical protein